MADDHVPPTLRFTEPNLTLRVEQRLGDQSVVIAIDLDQEFRPPWQRSRGPSPFTVRVVQEVGGLRQAAAAWIGEARAYPDGLERLTDTAEGHD